MTFHSDLTSAGSVFIICPQCGKADGHRYGCANFPAIERVIAINEKHEAERQRMMHGLNQAIVLIGIAALFGLAVMHGAEQSHRIALDHQEQEHVYRR